MRGNLRNERLEQQKKRGTSYIRLFSHVQLSLLVLEGGSMLSDMKPGTTL